MEICAEYRKKPRMRRILSNQDLYNLKNVSQNGFARLAAIHIFNSTFFAAIRLVRQAAALFYGIDI